MLDSAAPCISFCLSQCKGRALGAATGSVNLVAAPPKLWEL
jgi:hypothetical protein